jgi:hypothetical protein
LFAIKWLAFAAVLLLAVGAAVSLLGAWRWTKSTHALNALLDAARAPRERASYRSSDLAKLPPPVQRYLRAALSEGQPLVQAARLTHTGTFNASAQREQWKPFRSSQRVVIQRPGFVWNGRVALLPGLAVNVHDAYVAGEGILDPAILGLFSLAPRRDRGEMARGELVRFLAEAAWYPTAFLPGQGVRWEPIDARSARASLTDGDLSVALTVRFNKDDLIESVRAEARPRIEANQIDELPWEGHFWNYGVRDGMRVPLEGEVAWITPDGVRPYWRGTLQSIGYEFAH